MDHVEQFGIPWLTKTWRYIQEDRVEGYRVQMALLPLARTAMDKKAGQAVSSYAKKLEQMFDEAVPWQKQETGRRLRERLRGKVKPGEVVVFLEPGESSNDPLFKDAKITRE